MSNIYSNAGSIAEFIISPFFVWTWCSFIIVYTFKWIVTLQWESVKIKTHLKEAISTLKSVKSTEVPKQFRSLHDKMLQFDKIRRPWKEFCHSLIFPQSMEAGVEDSNKINQTIKCPRDTYDFFNPETMIQPSIDLRFYGAIPTQLTGMGILGTFCGLSSGIYLARHGLSGGNMLEIQNSLGQLLSGASLAFWTSIIGILTSIIFSRLESITIKQLQHSINDLNYALHSRFEFVTIEKMSSLHLQQNQVQTAQLNKVIEGLKLIHEDHKETNEEILQKVVNEFKKALTESAGQEIKYIAAAFKQIHVALSETRDSINISGQSLLETTETATKNFKKNLHELSHQFQSNFHQTTNTIQNTFKEAARDVTHSFNQSAHNIGDSLRKPTNEMNMVLRKLTQHISQTNEAWNRSTERSIQHSEQILKAHVRLSEFINPLVDASRSISGACKESQGALKSSAVAANQIATAVKQMEHINMQLKGSWEDYCKRFEGVDHSLYKSVSQTNQGINQYSEKMKNVTLELDKHMSKGLLSLAGAVGDLHQAVSHLPDMVNNMQSKTSESPHSKHFTHRTSNQ